MKHFTYLCMAFIVLAGCRHISDNNADKKNDSKHREVYNAHGEQVYSVFANRNRKTMTIVYANQLAISAVAAGSTGQQAGEELTVVTYQQENNKYWYGSYINGRIQSVEKLTLQRPDLGSKGWNYKLLSGRQPFGVGDRYINPSERITQILEKHPVVFP
ncbi:hypothetical protein [Arachidicoccus terrestris]|uniref:hypothetical protein n=1 Tax=Arachidicoccus terrestris TaxID=2875539 RepID=UPI001CC3D0F5|nr:hypothetical protein [Arachidicoccus terrestris]UAY53945.1 hypothetical protein K9M52_10690 [Arachidicoccus terrestris]